MFGALRIAARLAGDTWNRQKRRFVVSAATWVAIGVCLFMTVAALFAAFAVEMGQRYGAVQGCLAAAGLGIGLAALVAIASAIAGAVNRRRARRRTKNTELQSLLLLALPAMISRHSLPVMVGAAALGFLAASAIGRDSDD
ncbi:hypothetical protein DFR52_102693 [Hoeflea marina]|uniref:Uncharacterized protein n=1 Tax=Hoeflea marina TaxID=274592 RepID=A0A317PQ14_9HYPH|nr:hypothetical protein [Hoeflea marina]PWW02028.1 hypothetical protein DFR52_102693 [Hoeflea marina]